jgi:hypothetical protein
LWNNYLDVFELDVNQGEMNRFAGVEDPNCKSIGALNLLFIYSGDIVLQVEFS